MIYEKPDMLILMMDDDDVICSSIPDGIEDGTGSLIPGVDDGKDTGPFQP